jgi:iron complex transport system substrate-binding protein
VKASFLRPLQLLTAAAFSLTAFAASAEPFVIKHAQGEVQLKAAPQKILVLDVPSLDTLTALGYEPAGVISSNLPSYLQQYTADKYLKVGTLFEPDYEAINAAEADLVIVGGRSRAKLADVSAITPAVDNEHFISSVKANISNLGEIAGKQAEATALVATLDEKLSALKAIAPEAGTAMILITNAGKIGVYGPTSRVGWLHTEMGFNTVANAIDDRNHGGDAASFEYIKEKNPDWLFVIDRDAGVGRGDAGSAASQVLDNELVHKTTAWQKNQIVYLDPQAAYIVSSGYSALTTLIDQVYKAVSEKK